jgi:hypothetical protein
MNKTKHTGTVGRNNQNEAHRHVDWTIVPADLSEIWQRPNMIQMAARDKLQN